VPAAPLISRDLAGGAETTLFSVPSGSLLWTLNYHSQTLLFCIPVSAAGRHVVEYSLSGQVVRTFDVTAGFQDYNACISPDGTTLAFVRIDDSTGKGQLCYRDANDGASTVRVLWTFINSEVASEVRWLDDARVLFSGQSASGPINIIQNVSTGARANAPGLGLCATPDPRGEHVASLEANAGNRDLWLSRVDGSAMTQITQTVSNKLALNWSVDGRTLVYETTRGSPPVTSLELVSLPTLE
jgi:Tol biopolymer transport system component